MDKTPKYQKMCIEAFKDIGYIKPTTSSNLMIPAPNSIHSQQADDFMLSFEDEFDNIGLGSTIARPIGQLYQQDQLQGIMDYDNIYILASDFGDFVWEEPMPSHYIPRKPECTSMEQLWLCFVMLEKYLKKWDEGELKWTHS